MVDSSSAAKRGLLVGGQEVNWSGVFWLALTVVASFPIFWFGFQELGQAWVTPEYSHGPLIPVISLYLFLRELRHSPPVPDDTKNRWPGVVVMAVSLVIAIIGNMIFIADIVCYAMIMWTMGLVLVCFGWKRGRTHWAPVLHLVFMLPLPQFMYWQLSIFLQGISSQIGVWFVELAGIPVFLDGNIIDLGVYKLQVAEACSGLRYLFPILSFSYLFSILYRGPLWHKAVMLLSAAPLTVLMNSFRIGVIGILVNHYGIGAAEGFLHYFEGWVIFMACVGILFLMAWGLQRLRRDPLPLLDAIDLDTDGLGRQSARVLAVFPSSALISAAAVTIAVSLAWMFSEPPVLKTPDRTTFNRFPHVIDDWRGDFSRLDPNVEATLEADDYLVGVYMSPAERAPVEVFVAYYHDQTSGGGIHSPEVCLPVGGWEMASLEPYEVNMSGTGYGSFNLNRAVIQKGQVKQLVYYWFEQRGRRMTNDVMTKFAVFGDAWTRARKDGAMIRFVTSVNDNDVEAADARMQEMMRDVLKVMPEFVPF